MHCDAASAFQGNTGTKDPSLDVMMLKQQFFSESGTNNGHEQTFQYAFRQHRPNLQFLPQKLGEWDCGEDDISSAYINGDNQPHTYSMPGLEQKG